jgi:hypothetical protein
MAPGAKITINGNATITVAGTLKAAGGGTARGALTGTSWKGLVIASGGTLDLTGVDISGATVGIATNAGNALAKVSESAISATTPFRMQAGSKLAVSKVAVKAGSQSEIAGQFTASYMDYDKGSNEGLTLEDENGSMTISDSKLRGTGGGDFVVSRAGKLVKVEYTTIAGSHCGLHFSAVAQYDIDHVTDDSSDYAAMLYGSGPGPNRIAYSNMTGTVAGLDMQGVNGTLSVENSYTTKNKLASNASVKSPSNQVVANAKPR